MNLAGQWMDRHSGGLGRHDQQLLHINVKCHTVRFPV